MKINQIHNIFIYIGILIMDNDIMTKSPDYIEEKSLCFFGSLGKNEYIKTPEKIWKKYCKTWRVDSNNYELMNIINFLYDVTDRNVFSNFEKYIGDFEKIYENDLSHKAHFKLVTHINKIIDFDNRFFKLKILEKL